MKKLKIFVVAGAATMLSSCDLSQIPGLTGKLSMEDSKAIGAACRHSGRALEDCFSLNPNTYQSGVFEGWRDMNDYMVANQIEVVKPEIRNSAYKPDSKSASNKSADPHMPSAAPLDPGSNPAQTPGDAVPLAQGRQRWAPKGGAGTADAAPGSPPAMGGAGAATQQAVPGEEEAKVEEKPSVPEPARPWERKKDPKKHT